MAWLKFKMTNSDEILTVRSREICAIESAPDLTSILHFSNGMAVQVATGPDEVVAMIDSVSIEILNAIRRHESVDQVEGITSLVGKQFLATVAYSDSIDENKAQITELVETQTVDVTTDNPFKSADVPLPSAEKPKPQFRSKAKPEPETQINPELPNDIKFFIAEMHEFGWTPKDKTSMEKEFSWREKPLSNIPIEGRIKLTISLDSDMETFKAESSIEGVEPVLFQLDEHDTAELISPAIEGEFIGEIETKPLVKISDAGYADTRPGINFIINRTEQRIAKGDIITPGAIVLIYDSWANARQTSSIRPVHPMDVRVIHEDCYIAFATDAIELNAIHRWEFVFEIVPNA